VIYKRAFESAWTQRRRSASSLLVTESLAVLVGVEGEEWETVVLQTSAPFWRMIEKRRKEPTISLEEMKDRLAKPRRKREA